MALLEVKNLVKKFDDKDILKGISVALHEGQSKVVMGSSGCGKSTLLRCLNLLIQPTSGEIIFTLPDRGWTSASCARTSDLSFSTLPCTGI